MQKPEFDKLQRRKGRSTSAKQASDDRAHLAERAQAACDKAEQASQDAGDLTPADDMQHAGEDDVM